VKEVGFGPEVKESGSCNVLLANIVKFTRDIRDNADIDQCATNNGGCSADADCSNTPGSHTCTCKPGYTGDGVSCTGMYVNVREDACSTLRISPFFIVETIFLFKNLYKSSLHTLKF